MLIINKKVGETPLDVLKKLRTKVKKYKDIKMSYIGRLDPMAEGKMIVILGDYENKNRDKYLNFDKEYKASFLIGLKTDTGDILGLIKEIKLLNKINLDQIKSVVEFLKSLKKQKYPWFSGKTINGVKMFEIYKKGKTGGLNIPYQKINIKSVNDLKVFKIKSGILEKYVKEKLKKVKGDFRQEDIIKKWSLFFNENKIKEFYGFSFKIMVSSGTFIRALSEDMQRKLKAPVFLWKLKRIKIFVKMK